MIAQVVTGSQSERIRQLQADKLSSYNSLNNLSKQQAVSLSDYLCATGYLELHGSQYPVVGITKRGWNVLNGHANVQRRQEIKPDRKATQIEDELPEDRELFAKLRVKRWELAQEQGVPAFMIFSDRTLHDMARKRPQSSAKMLDVAGVGQRKLDQYGEAMLTVIHEEK